MNTPFLDLRPSQPMSGPWTRIRRIARVLVGLVAVASSSLVAQEAESEPPPDLGLSGIEVHGLFQTWYTAEASGGPHNFALRRMELALSGGFSERVTWVFMMDVAKALGLQNDRSNIDGTDVVTGTTVNQASRALQDAFVDVQLSDDLKLRVGQFLLPMSLEGLLPSAGLETIERTFFATDRARGGFFADVRDVGAALTGGAGSSFEYTGGIFNSLGSGVGTSGNEGFVGRVVFRPFGNALSLGGSGAVAENPNRSRYGVEAQLDVGRSHLRAEFMEGEDGLLRRRGMYGLFAYDIAPQVQLVSRIETWNPDIGTEVDLGSAAENGLTMGVSYDTLGGALRLQANYFRRWFREDLGPSRNMLMLNVESAW